MLQHGTGAANTALVFHAKRILSLYEADLPFAVSCFLCPSLPHYISICCIASAARTLLKTLTMVHLSGSSQNVHLISVCVWWRARSACCSCTLRAP